MIRVRAHPLGAIHGIGRQPYGLKARLHEIQKSMDLRLACADIAPELGLIEQTADSQACGLGCALIRILVPFGIAQTYCLVFCRSRAPAPMARVGVVTDVDWIKGTWDRPVSREGDAILWD